MAEPTEEELRRLTLSLAWRRLIFYCQNQLPFGEITVRVVNAEPTALLDFKPNVRFDLPLSSTHREVKQ